VRTSPRHEMKWYRHDSYSDLSEQQYIPNPAIRNSRGPGFVLAYKDARVMLLCASLFSLLYFRRCARSML
jgi:hypothetical protein